MIDFKQIIAEEISKAISVPKEELASYIEIPKNINNGDYAFPYLFDPLPFSPFCALNFLVNLKSINVFALGSTLK